MVQDYRSCSVYSWNRLSIKVIQHLERAGCDVRKLRRKFYDLKGEVLPYHREYNKALGGVFNRVRLKSLNDEAFNGLAFPLKLASAGDRLFAGTAWLP